MCHTVTTQKALLCHPQCACTRALVLLKVASHILFADLILERYFQLWSTPGALGEEIALVSSLSRKENIRKLYLKKKKKQPQISRGFLLGTFMTSTLSGLLRCHCWAIYQNQWKVMKGGGYNNTYLCMIPALGRYRQEGDEVKAWTTEHQPVSNSKCKQMKNKVAEGGDTWWPLHVRWSWIYL